MAGEVGWIRHRLCGVALVFPLTLTTLMLGHVAVIIWSSIRTLWVMDTCMGHGQGAPSEGQGEDLVPSTHGIPALPASWRRVAAELNADYAQACP